MEKTTFADRDDVSGFIAAVENTSKWEREIATATTSRATRLWDANARLPVAVLTEDYQGAVGTAITFLSGLAESYRLTNDSEGAMSLITELEGIRALKTIRDL